MPSRGLVFVALGLAATYALVVVSIAAASGGGTGSGGGGGSVCAPLTAQVRVGHADGNGNSSISVLATIRNCTNALEPVRLSVSVPGSGTVPFTFSTAPAALTPGVTLTMNASPIGSTPLALHYGQTYQVVATLSRTDATPATLATVTTPVTMPPGVVR